MTAAVLGHPDRVLMPNGRPIRFFKIQTRIWGLISGLLAAAFIAGLYYGFWEVHWTFGFLGISWDLKRWWDAGTWWPSQIGHWALYRHTAFRDQLEPGVGTLIALTVVVKNTKLWDKRVGPVRMVATPPIILAACILLSCLGVWLNYFGLPSAWAHIASATGHPGFNLDGFFIWAGKASLFILVWGIGIGIVLHKLWAPVGATIQGYVVDREVERWKSVPLYIRKPMSPPPFRERFMKLFDQGNKDANVVPVSRPIKLLMSVFMTWVVFVTLLGLMAHYYVGVMGHSVPYFAP